MEHKEIYFPWDKMLCGEIIFQHKLALNTLYH